MWKAQPSCGSGQACLNGACRDTCVQSELEMCPTGQECTGLPEGIQICLPKNGAADAGTPPPPPVDAGTGTGGKPKLVPADDPVVDPNQQISSGSGCGCTSGAATGPWALLGMLALARTRLRRRG